MNRKKIAELITQFDELLAREAGCEQDCIDAMIATWDHLTSLLITELNLEKPR